MVKSVTSEVVPNGPQLDGARSLEESVRFGLSHRLRVEVLAALHEHPATAPELAKTLRIPREKLRYHIEELLKDGSIEVAEQRSAGNMTVRVYRVTRLAFNSDEEWQAMSPADRQVEAALILQATWAEALASLWAGKFHSDPQVANIWNRILLDPKGRKELAEEQARAWWRLEEIEGEAATRRAATGDSGARSIVAIFGYERGRSSPPEPQPLEAGICEDATTVSTPSHTPTSERSIEEAVVRSIGHRIRVEILAALHEGSATAVALSRMIGQPIAVLSHHIRKLVNDGVIEIIGTRTIRNLRQPVYSVVKLPFYDKDDWRSLSPEERQVVSAVALRAAMAESLTSLWAGKLHSDPILMLAWKPVVLDEIGREEATAELRRSWQNICEIEVEAGCRLESSGAEGLMHVVTLLNFQRKRTTPPVPLDDRLTV